MIQKTEAGIAGMADVKTLILKCEDFRTVRFTFLKSKPNGHIFLETKFHIIDEVIFLKKIFRIFLQGNITQSLNFASGPGKIIAVVVPRQCVCVGN